MYFLYLSWKMCRVIPGTVTDSVVMSKDSGFFGKRSLYTREKSGRCKQMHQQYLQKVTRSPQGTCLSLKQTRKELMSALIRVRPASMVSCSPWRSSPGAVAPEGGGIIAAPHWSSCIWNLPELIVSAPCYEVVAEYQAQEIYSPAERWLTDINALHCRIIN